MARAFVTLLFSLVAFVLAAPPASAQDRDCAEFDNQAEAQEFYENSGPGDLHRLDVYGHGSKGSRERIRQAWESAQSGANVIPLPHAESSPWGQQSDIAAAAVAR